MEMAKLQLEKEKLEMEKVFQQQELDAKLNAKETRGKFPFVWSKFMQKSTTGQLIRSFRDCLGLVVSSGIWTRKTKLSWNIKCIFVYNVAWNLPI